MRIHLISFYLAFIIGCENSTQKEKILPVRLGQEGLYLTEDCTVSLGREPYIVTGVGRKYIYAQSVKIIPTNKSNAPLIIRTTNKSEKDVINTVEQSIIKMHFDSIPLLPKTLVASGTRSYIGGGNEGNSVGGEVVSLVVKRGTNIMPVQNVNIVDSQGTIVLRVPR